MSIQKSLFRLQKIALRTMAALALMSVLSASTPAKATADSPRAQSNLTLAPADSTVLQQRVIAYYFHGNQRCASCRKIEAYSHAAIEDAFPKELAAGQLVWRLVNVEQEGNEHFVKDYALFTKSLVLVVETDGKQVRWKNLTKVWEFLPFKERFYGYVQAEVRGYLTELP